MIRCVATSPSIDVTYLVDALTPGEVHRPLQVLRRAGGKGFNVARTVRALGGDVRVAGVLGGATGQWYQQNAAAEGIPLDAILAIGHETRTCVSICSIDGRRPTEVYEPAPAVGRASWQALVDLVSADAVGATTLSGSLSPDVGAGQLAALAHAARPGLVAVDLHGPAVARWLAAGSAVDVVKVNVAESVGLTGAGRVPAEAEVHAVGRLAQRLAELAGSHITVVTAGSHGAVAAVPDGALLFVASPASGDHPVGSGDAFLAALVLWLTRGLPVADALATASAAAAVNAQTPGAGLQDDSGVAGLARRAQVTVLRASDA